jgi:hypothetical protein
MNRENGSGRENVVVRILWEWFYSQISIYLGWKRSSLPIAQPRMLM